ncbi:MAG TPA: ATP-binding protein [Longimicrobiaceae bacterium]|nr:ATP-binding protein [Longimicrobiaceae bacterium]
MTCPTLRTPPRSAVLCGAVPARTFGPPATAPDPVEGDGRRAWRDGAIDCPGRQVTLFLDRQGYVTGCLPVPAAHLGWHLVELYAPESAARGDAEHDLRDAAARGSVHREGWWERSDGSRCWVEATLIALRGTTVTPSGFALVMRDASAAHRAGEALRLSEERLAGIVDLAREAIVSADHSGAIILFNRGAERVFGYRSAEILGRPFATLLAEGEESAHARAAGRVRKPGGRGRRQSDLGEVLARRSDGTVFPAAASFSSVEVGGRRVSTWMLRDVTAVKRAAADAGFLLRAGSALASSLDPAVTLASAAALAVETLGDLSIACAGETDAGPRRAAVAGVSDEPARTLQRLVSDPTAAEPFASALRTGSSHTLAVGDADALRAAGWPAEQAAALARLAPAVLHAVPLAVHGRSLGALMLLRARAAELSPPDAKLAADLAARVGLALESALLYEQACRAVQLRDEMVSVVSHDLRNPLNVIAMAVAMLSEAGADPPLPPAGQKYAGMIQRSAEQMDEMVRDLLDVARIESGRLALEPWPLAPAELLADTRQAFLPQAEAAGIALETEVPEELPAVWGDPHRLQQVLANLVGNALKFTPRGGRVTVRVERGDGAGVRFCVRDTGQGIPPEHQADVFDRFWQAARGDRRGLGLGLPIVKGIVEAHGGTIRVESAVGRGAAFWFTLPGRPPEVP